MGLDKNKAKILEKFLFAARDGDYSGMERLLLKHEFLNVSMRDSNGISALHWSCAKGHIDIVEFLNNEGAFINTRDSWGNTPLHKACVFSEVEIVDYLLRNGADPNLTNNEDKSPLDVSTHVRVKALIRQAVEKQNDDELESRLGRYATTDDSVDSSSPDVTVTAPLSGSRTDNLKNGESASARKRRSLPRMEGGGGGLKLAAPPQAAPTSRTKRAASLSRRPAPGDGGPGGRYDAYNNAGGGGGGATRGAVPGAISTNFEPFDPNAADKGRGSSWPDAAPVAPAAGTAVATTASTTTSPVPFIPPPAGGSVSLPTSPVRGVAPPPPRSAAAPAAQNLLFDGPPAPVSAPAQQEPKPSLIDLLSMDSGPAPALPPRRVAAVAAEQASTRGQRSMTAPSAHDAFARFDAYGGGGGGGGGGGMGSGFNSNRSSEEYGSFGPGESLGVPVNPLLAPQRAGVATPNGYNMAYGGGSGYNSPMNEPTGFVGSRPASSSGLAFGGGGPPQQRPQTMGTDPFGFGTVPQQQQQNQQVFQPNGYGLGLPPTGNSASNSARSSLDDDFFSAIAS